MVASGVALELVTPADPVVAAHRQEPAPDALRVREGIPDVLDRGVVRPPEPDGAPLPGRGSGPRRPRAGLARSRWRCRSWCSLLRGVRCLAARRRRSRLPRASSVASESRRCSQNPRNWSSQSSTSWSGAESDGVQPPRALGADRREAAVAQDLEMLRHGRLRDPELGLDDGGDRARSRLPFGEELEDPPPDRVAEDVERVHRRDDTRCDLYKSRPLFDGSPRTGRGRPSRATRRPAAPGARSSGPRPPRHTRRGSP